MKIHMNRLSSSIEGMPQGAGGSAVAEAAEPMAAESMAAKSMVARSMLDFMPEVDAAYYRWLTASNSYPAPSGVEEHILDLVRTLAQDPAAASGLVPRVPELIPQLLRDLARDDVSNEELARSVERDTVLLAEVIREANSAYYRPLQPVRTLAGALLMIGQNGLRMLLARIAFRPLIKMADEGFARQVAPLVWDQSEKSALAASCVASSHGQGVFEAYLAGLMQNVGLLVALRLAERAVQSRDGESRDGVGKLPASGDFGTRLFAVSRALSAAIAVHWDFPAPVAAAIADAGPGAGPGSDSTLANALARGDLIAKLRVLLDAGVVASDDAPVAEGLDDAERRCLQKLATPAG